MAEPEESPVLVQRRGGLLNLVLNRPRVLNTLNLEMIRRLRGLLDEAREDEGVRLIVLSGAGERGFCAGGDLKELARALQGRAPFLADEFFREEYDLDLLLHQFPKPVVALADGITMGGGLGLAAGADLVVVTERSRMAMPETRIGFFPDVGASGLAARPLSPRLSGVPGPHRLRGGGGRMRPSGTGHPPGAITPSDGPPGGPGQDLRAPGAGIFGKRRGGQADAGSWLPAYARQDLSPRPELDAWVAQHFAGKESLGEILASLSQCSPELEICGEVLRRMSERSPTALALTLKLLRANQGRPLPEVFRREARAAHFMVQHPDYLEGIRARLLDKDDQPRWQPERISDLGPLEVDL